MPTTKHSFAFIVVALFAASCGGASEAPPEYPPNLSAAADDVDAEPGTDGENPSAEVAAQSPSPPPAPVRVIAGESTPIEGPMPTLRLVSPRDGARIARGPVNVRVNLTNWSLAPDPGNHVHVIVDNEPYIAVRDVSRPFDLAALVHDNLGHDLAQGNHVVRMFPSRPTHESVKDPGAFIAFSFIYGQPTEGAARFDANAPLLTYSRPKGCNVFGSRVLLDFYLTNVANLAADGTRVRYTIDDQVNGEIVRFAPHYIEGLAAGEHTIRLQLIGANGEPVAGAYNDTSRTITVAATCPNPHGAAPMVTPAPGAPPVATAPQRPGPPPVEATAGHAAH